VKTMDQTKARMFLSVWDRVHALEKTFGRLMDDLEEDRVDLQKLRSVVGRAELKVRELADRVLLEVERHRQSELSSRKAPAGASTTKEGSGS